METHNIDTQIIGSKRIIYSNDNNTMNEIALDVVLEKANKSFIENNKFSFGLSVDSSMIPFLDLLASRYDYSMWQDTKAFSFDDMYLPSTHQDSMAYLLQQHLVEPLDLDKKFFHFVPYAPTVHRSATQLAADIRKVLNVPRNELPVFDLLLMSMNKKGQLGFLESTESMSIDDNALTTVINSREAMYPRISMTMPVINNAKTVIVLATGTDFPESFWLSSDNPISLINSSHTEVIIITDAKSNIIKGDVDQ